MSLLMRTRNHPSLRECFSGMLLLPVVKMSSKPSKWLFDIVGGIIIFLSLDLFSIMFKNIFLALFFFWGGGDRPVAPLMDSTLRQQDCFVLHYQGGSRLQVSTHAHKISRSWDMWFRGLVSSWGEITTENWSGIGVT